MLFFVISIYIIFPSYHFADTSITRLCNYLPLNLPTSQTPLNCTQYFGLITYNSENFFICSSNSYNSFRIYNSNTSFAFSLFPSNGQNLSQTSKCQQLFGDSSNLLVCACNNSLLTWDLGSKNLTGIYNESYWNQIPDFFAVSESQSSIVALQDEKIVKLIDLSKNLELKVFGAEKTFTRAIVIRKGSFIGIHYNYEGKRTVEIWDIVNIVKKYSWDIDLDKTIDIYLAQQHSILGIKNNTLHTWNFIMNTTKTINLPSNIKQITTLLETDSQIKNIIINMETEVRIYDTSLEVLKTNIIEKYPNPNFFLYSNSYNTHSQILLVRSDNYYFYSILNSKIIKILGLDLNSQIQSFLWDSASDPNNLGFSLFYQKNSLIYREKLNFSVCEPIELIKDLSLNFKSILQTSYMNESVLLSLNQDNTINFFNPNTRTKVKTISLNINFAEITAISCPKKSYIVLSGKSLEGYTLYLLDWNNTKLTKVIYETFSNPIKNLIYLNFRDFVAFENDGTIYIYDISSQNLINKIPHNLGNEFKYFMNLQNMPYVLATSNKNTLYFWNIFEQIGKTYTNFTEVSINFRIFCSLKLNSFKGKEILINNYLKDSQNIIEFLDLSNMKIAFQIVDTRPFSLKYLKIFHFVKNYIDYLFVVTDLTNDIWNLKTNTLENSFYLPKTQTNFIYFQSGDNLIFDVSNDTIAIWGYNKSTLNLNSNNFSFCREHYFWQNLTSTCEKCDSLCPSNCFSSQYDQCIFPQCNYLFEKTGSVKSSECYDCSSDNYFLQNQSICQYFNNYFTNNELKTYCFSCIDQFYYTPLGCMPCSANCKLCYGSSEKQCIECIQNYVLYNNVCYKKNEETSYIPLMIVYAAALGLVVLITLLCFLKMLYAYKIPCVLWTKTWKCLNSIFFDEKFAATKEKSTFIATPQQDNSQVNGLVQHNEIEVIFPSARTTTKRNPYLNNLDGSLQSFDHHSFLINSINKFKGQLMEAKEINKVTILKLSANFIAEIKEEIPFFLYELINFEENFSKNNYYQIKIVKKIKDGIYGPVFLGEKLCKTKMVIKMFFDNADEVNLKKIKKILYYLQEQEKVKYNSFSRMVPINSLVFSLKQNNFCLGVMEEYYDFHLDYFLSKNGKNIHFIQKLDMTLQILDSVRNLHDLHLSHRNLKANNILINNEDLNYAINLKIDDFSKHMKLSSILYSCKGPNRDLFQLAYIPPEFIDKKVFGNSKPQHDIWSIGILIYDIFYPDSSQSLDIPWAKLLEDLTEKYKKNQTTKSFNEILKSEILKDNYYCREDSVVNIEITEIINLCLKANPEKRINIHDLIWKIQMLKLKNIKE